MRIRMRKRKRKRMMRMIDCVAHGGVEAGGGMAFLGGWEVGGQKGKKERTDGRTEGMK